jgi:uncharacterized protein YPO0396
MDDTTMKLGLLMEAAQTHQKSAESTLRKLKDTAKELATIVREEVRSVVVEEFQSLAVDSNRATAALREVQRAANVRALVWSLSLTALCSAIPLLLACWLIPSRAEIAALRAKHDELATKIASLEERGGRIDLRRCGNGGRLCVRVDRKAPTYGEQSDYLIVRGY